MPGEAPEPLTAAEWKVMRIVWRLKEAAPRHDVYVEAGRSHRLGPHDGQTVLRRLVDKGYLTTTRVGNSFLYRPARSALKSLHDAATACWPTRGGDLRPADLFLVKRSKLSADELERLRACSTNAAPTRRNCDTSTTLLNGWAATWAAFMLRGLIESSVLLMAVGLLGWPCGGGSRPSSGTGCSCSCCSS